MPNESDLVCAHTPINSSNLFKNSRSVITVSADKFKVMNYSTPQLYGQIKTHKNGNPIRPVVAYYTHPAYLTAKYLANWFITLTGFTPRYTIKNSSELANNLKNQKFPANARLFSFDAKNLFTNVPVAVTIELMVGILRQHNVEQEVIDEFTALICVESNICMFRKKTYKFPDGLPMGGPLSLTIWSV